MHVLVLANGEVDDLAQVQACAGAADLVVCADGGTRHVVAAGLRPHVVIGDMDSLPPGLRAKAPGVKFVGHPRSKDETDLELALLYAAERGATEITVLGAWGGRIDHELANLLLLVHPRLAGIHVRVRTRTQEVLLVRAEATFRGSPGDLLSLLPIGGDAQGVKTSGLEYPLRDETLFFGPARGISNVLAEPVAHVSLLSGLLLAIHTRIPEA